MKVFIKGKGAVTLSQTDYVAQGGQASVFQKNGTAYKIYTDPKTAIPEAKFVPLTAIDDPDVVKPIDLLVEDKTAQPIGYTMRFVQDTYTLCQLFPKVFRDRNNIGPDKVSKVADELQKHVRDWSVSSSRFSELSDWFSFAVLVCQLYLGIHPYKGTHAGSAHVPPEQRLEHRMRHHVSIFDPSVSVPKVCASPSVIPAGQREWLQAVLQEGKRLPPPAPGGAAPVPVQGPAATLRFGGSLIVTELAHLSRPILGWYQDAASTIALLDDGIVLNGHVILKKLEGTTLLGATPKYGRPIALNLHRGVLQFHEIAERRVTTLQIEAREIAKSGDRFYLRNGTQVLEFDFREYPDRIAATASHPVANTLENASQLFDGVAIQNMLGSTFVSLFPRTRAGYQLRVRELDGYRVVDARFEGETLMVVGSKNGEYRRLVFCCENPFNVARLVECVPSAPGSINFTVTDGGACVSLTEDERILVYGKGMKGQVEVSDPAIGGDMRLLRAGGKTAFIRGDRIFSISMGPRP